MKINSFYLKTLASLLAFTMMLTPSMVVLAFAQDAPQTQTASDDEVQPVQQLAQAGYLGDKKDFYLSAKTLTEDDVTDAILKAKDYVMAADLKTLNTNKAFQTVDLQAFLDLVKDKEEDIKARKASAWKIENRLQKMIALKMMTPASESASETPAATAPAPTDTPVPAVPTATPVPGPSRQEFGDLKESFKTLDNKITSLQSDFDKRTDSINAIQKQNEEFKTAVSENQEQLKLVKKLIDHVQDDIKKSEEHMSDVEKKVEQKLVTDTQMQQEMTVMHKDLRDDTEDISVLKEEVAKLDKTDSSPHGALDDFLTSKWLPGGALIVGLAALTLSLVKK
jgi:DNA repair exonuclease SbcCD ATPase subunit